MRLVIICLTLSLLTSPALLCGCGESRVPAYPTRGSVSFSDGEPIRTGIIELESIEHGTTATGRIQDDGTFVLGTYTPDDGAVAGAHRVIVIQVTISDGTVEHSKDHGRAVPTKYAAYHTSGLETNVDAVEDNNLKIELQ